MVTGVMAPHGLLDWRSASVDGRDAVYGVAGDGPPVLFLHGWALGNRSYKRSLRRLACNGLRVFAPALPGFGGTERLPDEQLTLQGYAAWVRSFLTAVGVEGPVWLIGHSFGGGVAIQTAHDWPTCVSRLILVNSIGGSVWSHARGTTRAMRDRPLWDWGLHLQADILPFRQLTRVLPVILEDAVPNLLRRPRSIWHVAHLARAADLTRELEELKRRRLPVVILWGQNDTVIPHACLASMRSALGADVITVPGNHSWLLADPDTFGEIITNVLSVPPSAAEPAKDAVAS
jgi:pimeloyl-ACP methyl ester carboxylesterase